MKIKTKKEMNLPELIEWGWKNIEQVERKEFKSNIRDSFGNYSTVQFSVDGYGFKTDGVSHKDTFTVEVEEEITEEPAIQHDKLIKDIEKLKEEKAAIEMYLDAVKVYKPMYEEVNRKYKKLTEHIRLKELHNPSISRYKDLMYFINEMQDK